jgi:methyl-accepting chemotaxis protein
MRNQFYNLSIKGKFGLIGATILALVALQVAMIFFGARVYADLIKASETAAAGLRNHMTGDMMHDGLRSDVYYALFVSEFDPARAEEALQAVADNAEEFRARIAANKALALPESLRPTLNALDAPLEAYITQAQEIVAIAFTDRQAAIARLQQFDERFVDLEGAMASASEEIEAAVADLSAQGVHLEYLSIVATIIAALLGLAVATVIFLFGSRNIASPIAHITGALKRLADGDTTASVDLDSRGDEIGKLAETVAVFRGNAIEKEHYETQNRQSLTAREERQKRIDALIGSFRAAAAGIMGTMAEDASGLKQTAGELSSLSHSASGDATSASSASEQASNNVQAVAAATEQLVASVGEIAQRMGETTRVVASATEVASTAGTRIASLSTAAEKIGNVVSLIHDIAEQTNLLALNATIEAARAGEMGKGFAVVASEVKALAGQTAKATEEISSQIHQVQTSTGGAVSAIQEIGSKIKDIHEYAVAVQAAVEEQNSATAEIGRTIQDAASGTRQVASNVANLRSSVGQANDSADHVLSVSQNVAVQSDKLRQTIEGFLKEVAAA